MVSEFDQNTLYAYILNSKNRGKPSGRQDINIGSCQEEEDGDERKLCCLS